MTSLEKIDIVNNCYMKKNPSDGILFPVCDRVANPVGGNGSILDLLISNVMSGNKPVTNTLEVPTYPKEEDTKLLFSNEYLKQNKNRAFIQGLRNPKIKLEEHQDYIAYKESVFLDDKKNIGIIFPDLKRVDNMIITNEVNREVNKIRSNLNNTTTGKGMLLTKSMGGGGANYYEKYMKYKLKYIRLKNELSLI